MTDPFEQAVERDLPLLRRLVDPGEPIKGGARASDLGAPGSIKPALRRLEASGLAVSNRGWWRKTRDGVLLLRQVDSRALDEEDQP